MENEDYRVLKRFTLEIEKNPENIDAYRERASVRFKLNEYKKAMKIKNSLKYVLMILQSYLIWVLQIII